ncbi:MAG TPA: hypothetical protein VND65_08930 [Candidatus Binatia bacterium]|nr:hypothetical protein [Candidatus Binatia bacterium]
MISVGLANAVLLMSLLATVGSYLFISRREGSYLNIATPSLVLNLPAFYLLPLLYTTWFGNDATAYAYVYVYLTLGLESCVFAYVYTRPAGRPLRLPFSFAYHNFRWLALACLAISVAVFLPVLLEFREYILDPRRIYEQTRTGFGASFFLSSTFAYLAVILILFTEESRFRKAAVIVAAAVVLSLHGSKGQVLGLVLLLGLYAAYVSRQKLDLLPAIGAGMGVVALVAGLFAATMSFGGAWEAIETISQYSTYTQNAMLVIDSNLPPEYGRLTWESNVIALVPRAMMPNKPKDFGEFYLAAKFFPSEFDQDTGAPAFGIGLQYADFGFLAIIYLLLFTALKAWLARIFVTRLRWTKHPADFIVVAFLADIALIPAGGTGWLLPETLVLAMLVRFGSSLGAEKVYREQ